MFEKINQFRNAPERTVLTLTFSESISVGKQGRNGGSQSAQSGNNGSYGQGSQGGKGGSQSAGTGNNSSYGTKDAQSANGGPQSTQAGDGGSNCAQGKNGASRGSQNGGSSSQGQSLCGCSSGGTSGSIQCSHTLKVRLCDAIAVMLGVKIVFTSLMMLKCKLGK